MHAAKTITMTNPSPPIQVLSAGFYEDGDMDYLQHMPIDPKIPIGTAIAAFDASSDTVVCQYA